MKRIRQGNDFVFIWAIERNGSPENLSIILDAKLTISIFCKKKEIPFEIVDNKIRIEFTPIILDKVGTYNLKLTYTIPDTSADKDRKCEVDIDAFQIVAKTDEADNPSEFSANSDVAIGLQGEKGEKGASFTFSDFTPEQLLSLKGADGKNVYEIWLNYHTGSEQDFINSITSGNIDLTTYLSKIDAVRDYQPKGNYLVSEADPTVPQWAKEASKPTYTPSEIGAAPTNHTHSYSDLLGRPNITEGAKAEADSGSIGDMSVTDDFLYVYIGTGWKKIALVQI